MEIMAILNCLTLFSTAFLREHKTVSDLNGHVHNHGSGFFSEERSFYDYFKI